MFRLSKVSKDGMMMMMMMNFVAVAKEWWILIGLAVSQAMDGPSSLSPLLF